MYLFLKIDSFHSVIYVSDSTSLDSLCVCSCVHVRVSACVRVCVYVCATYTTSSYVTQHGVVTHSLRWWVLNDPNSVTPGDKEAQSNE